MICVVHRADDPLLVTAQIPGALPGLCSRCERPVSVTPGTRRSYPDAQLVCIQCLRPDELVERPPPMTVQQFRELIAFFLAR